MSIPIQAPYHQIRFNATFDISVMCVCDSITNDIIALHHRIWICTRAPVAISPINTDRYLPFNSSTSSSTSSSSLISIYFFPLILRLRLRLCLLFIYFGFKMNCHKNDRFRIRIRVDSRPPLPPLLSTNPHRIAHHHLIIHPTSFGWRKNKIITKK